MAKLFETVTIVGVGLLGGSLGLALKAKALAGTIRGVGRRQSSLDTALAIGSIDEDYLNAADAARGADLIVLCAPAAMVPQHLDEIRSACGTATVITDVASTKAEICAHAKQTWPKPYRFVGSHPMAGSEKFGPENANAKLYEGSICLVEPQDGHAPDAHAAVVNLWEQIGARVVPVDPITHDAMVAMTSHVPHIAASALTQVVQDTATAAPFIGSGFRDATRIAEGRPELWRDICLTNSEAIRENLAQIIQMLQDVSLAIQNANADELDEFFRKGHEIRRKVEELCKEP